MGRAEPGQTRCGLSREHANVHIVDLYSRHQAMTTRSRPPRKTRHCARWMPCVQRTHDREPILCRQCRLSCLTLLIE